MSAGGQTFKIGRGQGCDVILTHVSVSRRHAELIIGADGALEISDLGSTGGTFLLRNGKELPVDQTRLQRTDSLRLGDYEISVADLLARIRGTGKEAALPASAGTANPTETAEQPKTRMVRCDCGSIKPRGQPCPACGT